MSVDAKPDRADPGLPDAAVVVGAGDIPFGANPLRLGGWHWLAVLAILGLVFGLTPGVWERIQHFETGLDYRIPYALSSDYWLYGCRLRQAGPPDSVVVLGDSVVWGEFVLPDGTLSHFLDREAGVSNRFVNAGVNGLFPLALEGLVHYYGRALENRRVLLHCNLLWLTSPKADLSAEKEEPFNHAGLVPQFYPRIRCYRADAHARLGAAIERSFPFLGWVTHLQYACYDQKSIPNWTLADDGREPAGHPNALRNPFGPLALTVPGESREDPQRGPRSPRHKPWLTGGREAAGFEWVDLEASVQWRAFRELVERLRRRGNDVRVVVGPFNEHMIARGDLPVYRRIRDGIAAWMASHDVPCVVPEPLASDLYADASHPLTEGYARLAHRLRTDPGLAAWFDPK